MGTHRFNKAHVKDNCSDDTCFRSTLSRTHTTQSRVVQEMINSTAYMQFTKFANCLLQPNKAKRILDRAQPNWISSTSAY